MDEVDGGGGRQPAKGLVQNHQSDWERPPSRMVRRTAGDLFCLSREPKRVQLVTKPSARQALNLMDGKQIEFPFTLSPLEPALLALMPR